MSKTKIYVLINPFTLKVRYIGITCSTLGKRLSDHIYTSVRKNGKTHKDNWIKSIYKYGEKPIIRQIAQFNSRLEARDLEIKLIKKYKNKHKLVNTIDEGKFQSSGKKSARVYLTKPIYLYDKNGIFIKKFNSSRECAKELNLEMISIKKILSRKKKFGLNIKYKFQLSRIRYRSLSPILEIGSRTKTFSSAHILSN